MYNMIEFLVIFIVKSLEESRYALHIKLQGVNMNHCVFTGKESRHVHVK